MAEMMAIDRVRARTKLTNQQDEYCDATLLALGPLGAEVQTPSYLLDYPVGTAIDTQISSDGENTFYEGVISAPVNTVVSSAATFCQPLQLRASTVSPLFKCKYTVVDAETHKLDVLSV